jgi:guanylate kinase
MTAPPSTGRRGLMLVMSSPSGAGKTTISRRLLGTDPNLMMSVSATTRPRRPSESDGHDYYFVDDARFDAMIAAGEFLEWAWVLDRTHRYGTPAAPVEAALAAGRDVLFDIDWQGTQQLYEKKRDDLVRVFILPPSMRELERRLRFRAQDADEVIARRMAKAADEITHWSEYDYVLVNENIETCLSKVVTILASERLKRDRQTTLSAFVRTLLEEKPE